MAMRTTKPMAASIPELARLSGLSEGFLYQRANAGTLPGCRRIGRRFVVHLDTFEAWLREGEGDEGTGGQPQVEEEA